MEQGELVLHYQPKASLKGGEVRSVEALVRWQHPDRGLLSPGEFLPLAEHTGLMRPLTLYVLDRALGQCHEWHEQGLSLGLAVNLSARDLLDVELPREVATLLTKWEIDPGQLELEVTESTILADPLRARSVLTRLSQLGVRVAIDDFGSGYTSLGYLKRLPVDVLKIDKSFVSSMGTDAHDAVIVRSAIDLGHNLGLEVVAEGVETEETWHDLARLGCDVAQGFYLARPMESAALTRWLLARGSRRLDDVQGQDLPRRRDVRLAPHEANGLAVSPRVSH
jgi:EAL domain-containing protein (putative c-di-GMP-specific phosphodiesterase class I)